MQKVKKISENIIEFEGNKDIKEDSKGWLDIPELNISVEIEVHNKNKSWNKLGLKDREKELLTYEQCIWLTNSKYSKTLKMDGSSTDDDFFIQQAFNLNRRNGYVARFYSYSGRSDLGFGGGADDSGWTLGVRFVRKKGKKVKNV